MSFRPPRRFHDRIPESDEDEHVFENILIPLDLSGKTQMVLDAALALPGSFRVTLLHVIETIRDVESEEIEDFYQILRERAEECLEGWAKQLEQAGVEVHQKIVVGKRAVEIARLAEELGCDLIILRSHQIDPESPIGGIGTISHQVAVLAGCSVMLMK